MDRPWDQLGMFFCPLFVSFYDVLVFYCFIVSLSLSLSLFSFFPFISFSLSLFASVFSFVFVSLFE